MSRLVFAGKAPLAKTCRLNAWKAFSVSGVSARRFWESSGEERGGYKGLVIMGLHGGSVLPAPEG